MRLNYIQSNKPNFTTYGALYNWYAATNAANISASGWVVPTKIQFEVMQAYLSTNPSHKLRTTGTTYWTSPNTDASNSSGFNGRGGGYRTTSVGDFVEIKDVLYIMLSTYQNIKILSYNSGSVLTGAYSYENYGVSVRLLKSSTILTNGQTGTYTGNDGRVYTTICIDSQEWMSENLKETKYRDGSLIPILTNHTAWNADTTGARCSYNNA